LALDRDNTLKKAEKLLRQGRLDGAIAEYVKLVEDQPRDWNTANVLGDLYARAGQTDRAVAHYTRIADHFMQEGFYPKAAALYKKILKINKEDEATQLQLAEISARQGLLADAKSHLNAVAARRKARGDRRGEAEIVVRLGTIDPADLDARITAARTLDAMGEDEGAAERYRGLHPDLLEKGRKAEADEILRALVRIRPLDVEARGALARAALEAGDVEGAREFLDRDIAGNDPALLLALVDLDLRAGDVESARSQIPALLGVDAGAREKLLEMAWSLAQTNVPASFACIDPLVNRAVEGSEFQEAATTLQEFVRRVPGHIDALLRLVEVCVDGGFESAMYDAQVLLTDAYLEAGQASEARVIAEDLVAREPWERAHIDRFRRALVMLKVSDPDAEIAERLSGQAPFTATDHFVDLSELTPEPAPEEPPPGPESLPAPAGPSSLASDRSPAAGAAVAEEPSPLPQASTERSASASSGDEIDLTGALGTLDEPPAAQPAYAEEPERRVAPPGSAENPDYSAQHMTLARTYLEMGMLQQAEHALEAAARAPSLRFQAGAMLGRLLRDRGEMARALEWLERAAEAPPTSVEEGRGLMYDFGVALDNAGETARALALFLELQAEAGDYRDVPERIDRLARVQSGG
jgi:tetratricopeptide (TPR) repeat protein